MKKIVWSIAGFDPSSGAGISLDLLAFHRLNLQACAIITAITAQNSHKVHHIDFLSAEQVSKQIQALSYDGTPAAIKVGMVGSAAVLQVLKNYFQHYPGPVVLDPILFAGSGISLIQGDVEQYIEALIAMFPYIDVLTPNRLETEKLLKRRINTREEISAAAQQFLRWGVKAVIIKGGHSDSLTDSQDYWSNGVECGWLSSPRCCIENRLHGAGCLLSSSITACLSLGYPLREALVIAKMYLNQGIRLRRQLSKDGAYLLNPSSWPEQGQDLPYAAAHPPSFPPIQQKFPDCGVKPIGLYPVVDRATWLEKLLPLGVTSIQLRIKDLQGRALRQEIQQAIQIAGQYNARLFINDYWRLAIELGAYGVHLGQDDLIKADLQQILQAHLRLGISTHSYYELAKAIACRPSYIAWGPIYHTTSKIMPFPPQGLRSLSQWCHSLNYPMVAIGGIDLPRLPEVLAAGVSGVALISAITQASNPAAITEKMLTVIQNYQAGTAHGN